MRGSSVDHGEVLYSTEGGIYFQRSCSSCRRRWQAASERTDGYLFSWSWTKGIESTTTLRAVWATLRDTLLLSLRALLLMWIVVYSAHSYMYNLHSAGDLEGSRTERGGGSR